MVGLASSRGIFALCVLVLGIAQGSCEVSKSAVTHSLAPNLKAALDRFLAMPRPADRLKGLAETAKDISLKEIPGDLQAAERFQQLRVRAVFQEAVLKRWSELAPRTAFAHIAA